MLAIFVVNIQVKQKRKVDLKRDDLNSTLNEQAGTRGCKKRKTQQGGAPKWMMRSVDKYALST